MILLPTMEGSLLFPRRGLAGKMAAQLVITNVSVSAHWIVTLSESPLAVVSRSVLSMTTTNLVLRKFFLHFTNAIHFGLSYHFKVAYHARDKCPVHLQRP